MWSRILPWELKAVEGHEWYESSRRRPRFRAEITVMGRRGVRVFTVCKHRPKQNEHDFELKGPTWAVDLEAQNMGKNEPTKMREVKRTPCS